MFGYCEGPYAVVARGNREDPLGAIVVELRKSNSGRQYVSLRRTGEPDRAVDTLLLFATAEQAYKYWNKLIQEPEVPIKVYPWSERIEHHHIGYRDDGAVVMY